MKIVKNTYSELFLYSLFFLTWILPESIFLRAGAVIRPMDAAAILVLLAGIAHQLYRGKMMIPRDRSLAIMGVFLFWGALSFGWAEHRGAVILQSIQWLELALILILLGTFLRTEAHLRQFVLALLVFAAVVQFFLGVSSLPVILGLKSYVRERTDPFFSAVLLTYLCAFLAEREAPIRKPLMLVLIFISSCNILFSINRKDIIGAAMGLGLLLMLSSRKRMRNFLWAILAAGVALSLVFALKAVSPQLWQTLSVRFHPLTFQEEDLGSSVEGRITHIAITLNILKDHPIGGLGLGNQSRLYRDYFVQVFQGRTANNTPAVHNGFLLILDELGLVGIAIFIALLWRAAGLITLYRKMSHRAGYPGLLLGSACLLPLVLLKFATAHAGIGTFFPIFFLLALRSAYERILARSPVEADPESSAAPVAQATGEMPLTIATQSHD
jgi:hypothetical protein